MCQFHTFQSLALLRDSHQRDSSYTRWQSVVVEEPAFDWINFCPPSFTMTSWSSTDEFQKNGPAQKSRLDKDLNGPKVLYMVSQQVLNENLKLANLEF